MSGASLTTQIADLIGDQIIRGELRPNSRIQELKLAQDHSVSRGTVREALLILESRVLVRITPRRGAVVRSLENREIDEIADATAEVFLVFLRRLSAWLALHPRMNLSTLESPLSRARSAADAGDEEAFVSASIDFYRGGLELMGASYLRSLVECVMSSWLRLGTLARRNPRADLHDDARVLGAIWQAALSSDAARLGELLRAHCRRQARLAKAVMREPWCDPEP